MKTWNDYKDYVKDINQDASDDIEEAEQLAYIISAIIDRRKKLGLSQRDLTKMCNVPQSSIGRIEPCKTTPNISTLINIFKHLGLSFTIRNKLVIIESQRDLAFITIWVMSYQ